MNLKTLSLSVLVLAVLSGIVAWINRPLPPPDQDPRVGGKLLTPAVASAADRITLSAEAGEVELIAGENGDWRVASFHDFPADMQKLRRFVRDLTEADIDRVVTRNPERAKRLEFGTAKVALSGSGSDGWTADFGKTAERGGRYVRLEGGDDAPAYLTRFSSLLDTTSKNWAQSKLVNFTAADIAEVTFTLGDAAPLTVSRESADAPWTSADLPDDQVVAVSRVSSSLSSLTNLRFTDVLASEHQDVVDAAASTDRKTIALKTFGGDQITLNFARRAEQVIESEETEVPSTEESEEESADDAVIIENEPETIPAGPVIVRISGDASIAPLQINDDQALVLKVADFTYTSLPTTRDELTNPAPNAPPAEEQP